MIIVQTTQTLSAFTYTMLVCPDVLLGCLCMTTSKVSASPLQTSCMIWFDDLRSMLEISWI